ncbi:MAG: hypothetical protein ACFCU4_07995 [Puniceicoccaceae bacterium]
MKGFSDTVARTKARDLAGIRARLALGVVGSLAIHTGLLWAGASVWERERGSPRRSEAEAIRLEYEPLEERFVEANPDLPENPPDDTPLIAARNQQAASEEPERREEPALIPDAGGEIPNPKVVEAAEVVPPQQILEAGIYSEEPERSEEVERGSEAMELPLPQLVKRAQSPFEEREDLADGAGIDFDGEEEPWKEGEDGEEAGIIELGPRSAEAVQTGERVTEGSDAGKSLERKPLPQPKLSPEVIRGPVQRADTRAERVGVIAVESRLSEFGAYQQRLYEAISAEWNLLAWEVGIPLADQPSVVRIRFRVGQRGEVSEIEVEETTAGTLATQLCTDAIRARAPYGLWNEEMVRSLGESTEIKIGFRYF